jgi:hypothetical protein
LIFWKIDNASDETVNSVIESFYSYSVEIILIWVIVLKRDFVSWGILTKISLISNTKKIDK